uniref:Solute carrier family 46 member 3 n=1 Tax=Plectus sambesii TaxID=2011161 RepID=A0A914VXA6_9BILA
MFTSFIKYPVFQSLMYDKLCLEQYDEIHCANQSVVHDDKKLQADVNHLYLYSSIVLTVPSIFTAFLLGSVSDTYSRKIPLMIPFVGLILGDVVYLVQTTFMSIDARWLLLSDACFGLCGGYTAIIGTMFAYGVRQTWDENRSLRIAALEGSIGLGGTIGFAVSGVLRNAWGYTNVFLFSTCFHFISFFYLLLRTEEFSSDVPTESVGRTTTMHLRDIFAVVIKKRDGKATLCLQLILFAFAVEYLSFAGVLDVQYSFFRYKLGWDDLKFGWFSGLGYGLSTAAVLIIYPILKQRSSSDAFLAGFGLCCKVVSLVVLAFVFADWMAYTMTVLFMFSRFPSTGMRAVCSRLVALDEQGKVFAAIALMEGVITLLASLIFNGLYPWTLNFFAGTCFLLMAALLFIPIGILYYVHGSVERPSSATSNNAISDTAFEENTPRDGR